MRQYRSFIGVSTKNLTQFWILVTWTLKSHAYLFLVLSQLLIFRLDMQTSHLVMSQRMKLNSSLANSIANTCKVKILWKISLVLYEFSVTFTIMSPNLASISVQMGQRVSCTWTNQCVFHRSPLWSTTQTVFYPF